jgi:hypothetical protein
MDTNITFQVKIYANSKFQATIERYFDTKEEAQELASVLPKWVKAKIGSIGYTDPANANGYHVKYYVYCWAPLYGTSNNERNESGIKRLHKLIDNYSIEYVNTLTYGGYDTLEEALAALQK